MDNQAPLAPIRLLVADDFEPVRRSIKRFLTAYKHILVVGEASSYQEMMDCIAALKPDVVLFDLRMPGDTKVDVKALRKLAGNATLICMSIWTEDTRALAEKFGCPLLDKGDLASDLVPTIETAAQNKG